MNLNGKKKTFTTFTEIIKLKEKVSQLISQKLIIAGTVGLFIFEESNDFHFIANEIKDKKKEFYAMAHNALANEFTTVSTDYENNEIKCQLDEGYSFKISFSSECLLQFNYLRQVVFDNSFMLPLYHSILHFINHDSKFIVANFKLEFFLEYFVEYCIQNKYIQEPAKASIEYSDTEPDKLSIWYSVYDSLNYALKEPGSTGQILLNFYRDNGFKSEEIVLKSKFNSIKYSSSSFKTNLFSVSNLIFKSVSNSIFKSQEIDIEPILDLKMQSMELFQAHFFTVFNFISKAIDISSVWDFVETAVELNPSRYSLNYIEICCKSPCLYAKDAFLLLFTNINSMHDSVKFELYSGKKFIKHAKKGCYLPKLVNDQLNQNISSNRLNSSIQCYSHYFTHASTQFQKAREYGLAKPGNMFKFQLKFGNFYLTSISPTLLSSDKTVTLSKLINEFSFNTYDFGPKQRLGMNDRMTSLLLSNFSLEQDYAKKKPFQRNYCAFNSNINNNMDLLHSMLNNNGFNLVVGSNFLVYLCIKNVSTKKSKSFKLKYNSALELVNLNTMLTITLQ